MGEDKATKYASSAPSVDYIKIPGELLKPQNHTYNIQVTDELWEAIYFDQVQLIAVDHPDSVDVYVDERFMPSPVPGYKLYQAGRKHLPVAATDKAGDNLLPLILKKDDKIIGIDVVPYRPNPHDIATEILAKVAKMVDLDITLYIIISMGEVPAETSRMVSTTLGRVQLIEFKGLYETLKTLDSMISEKLSS